MRKVKREIPQTCEKCRALSPEMRGAAGHSCKFFHRGQCIDEPIITVLEAEHDKSMKAVFNLKKKEVLEEFKQKLEERRKESEDEDNSD